MTRDTAGTAVLERTAVGGDPTPAGSDLHAALVAGDLTVHLQPQVALVGARAGRTVGVEALVRWEHPSRGVLGSRELLPVAARSGLHGSLTGAVLDLALGCAARWWSGRAPLPVSVTLAAEDVVDPDLPGTVAAALARYTLPPRALTVEVVESSVAHGARRAHAVLRDLRGLGVSVSLDHDGPDAGALTSSRRLPVDELRLGPALVVEVARDARAAAAVRHTVALAHLRGLRVVAAGVEDAATLPALAALGCDGVQGSAIAAAMPVDHFAHWLRTRRADRPVRHAAVRAPRGSVDLA